MTVADIPWLVLVGLVAALRLAEVALSRRRLSGGGARAIPERTFPFMAALHALWLAGCAAEPLLLRAAVPGAVLWSALVVWLAALGLRLWMFRAMGRWWNVRIVERPGQAVVTGGPYRWVRHPNYLAVILELAAFPALLGAYWTALLASLANAPVLWLRIRAEEAYLFSHPAYRAAFAGKKRLLPGLF